MAEQGTIAKIQAAMKLVLAGLVIDGQPVTFYDCEPKQDAESFPDVAMLQKGGSSNWNGANSTVRRERFNLGCRWKVPAGDIGVAQVHVAALHDAVRDKLRENPSLGGVIIQLHLGDHEGPLLFSDGGSMFMVINQPITIEVEEV